MFESLVSSRIRRALLEYLLSHPNDQFYLRGLSKDLRLSVSPLRRELKRLERSGMLKAVPEGNMLFYTVNTGSSAFLQISSLGTRGPEQMPPASSLPPAVPSQPAVPIVRYRRASLATGVFAGAAALLLAGLVYVGSSRQHKTQITLIMPRASASGAMKGARWRVVPGSFGGGFSSDTSAESY